MTQRRVNVLTAMGLVGLLVIVASTAPLWSRLLRRQAEQEDEPTPGASPAAPRGPAAQRTLNVKLYFEAADRPGLQTEERDVALGDDLATQLKTVVEELVKGSRSGLVAPLPPATKVLDVFVSKQGIAYVDLSRDAADPQGGSQQEQMAVWAIVNTLVTNFPGVKGVQILLDDVPAATFAGHVDLSRPLVADLSLLAGGPQVPGGGAAPNVVPPTPVTPASPPGARP